MRTVQTVQPAPLLNHHRRRALRQLAKGNSVLFQALPETVQRKLVSAGFVQLVDGGPVLTPDGQIAAAGE